MKASTCIRKTIFRTPCDSSWFDNEGKDDRHSVARCSSCHSGFTLQRSVLTESGRCKLVDGEYNSIFELPIETYSSNCRRTIRISLADNCCPGDRIGGSRICITGCGGSYIASFCRSWSWSTCWAICTCRARSSLVTGREAIRGIHLVVDSVGESIQAPCSSPVIPVRYALDNDILKSILTTLEILAWILSCDIVDQIQVIVRRDTVIGWRKISRTDRCKLIVLCQRCCNIFPRWVASLPRLLKVTICCIGDGDQSSKQTADTQREVSTHHVPATEFDNLAKQRPRRR